MRKVYILVLAAIVGVLVALTYFIFEQLVHVSIDFVWDHVSHTNELRLLIIPVGLALSFAYFAAVHYIDPKSEHTEAEGLGHIPPATLTNYGKVLFIGLLSLLAGASLGPEAILVPACMIVGLLAAQRFMKGDKEAMALLSGAGFIALFAAFFNSFIVGLLSVYLVIRQAKTKLSMPILLIAIVSSAASTLTLWAIRGRGLVDLPPMDWGLSLLGIVALALVGLAGYLSVVFLKFIHDTVGRFHSPFTSKTPWWLNAIYGSLGLSVIYLLAGPLVQFTGNESIQPLIELSPDLSLVTIAFIVIAKIIAIAWSKAMGYRGGLIFPTIFVMTGIILIASSIAPVNYIYGIAIGFVGVFIADRKAQIMFGH